MIAVALGETPRDWSYARGKYGMDDAFQGVCQELLAVARSRPVNPIFDAVLIDEAQDLPPEFFQLVYLFTGCRKQRCLPRPSCSGPGQTSPTDQPRGSCGRAAT
jgi:superfamily I DNA and RNA helicase